MKRLLPALCLLTLAFGCSTSDDAAGGSSADRGPIGKADLIGSCAASSCDGQAADGNCWCDDACVDFGDCCADKPEVCGAQTCGGIAGLGCPDGQTCEPDPQCVAQNGTDCFGTCEPLPTELPCGGFAGLPCPEGLSCVDDPADDCDPQNGGADCSGICVEPSEPDLCLRESDCGGGETCDHSECLSGCAPDEPCPKICFGQCLPIPTSSCEQAGGVCKSSPLDPTFAANCEELGLAFLDAPCTAFNQSCCVLPDVPGPSDFCNVDTDCDSGDVCDMDSCFPSCPLCQDCNHVCVPEHLGG